MISYQLTMREFVANTGLSITINTVVFSSVMSTVGAWIGMAIVTTFTSAIVSILIKKVTNKK